MTETQDGGDMCVLTDDSPCTAQTNTALQSDYTSVKKKTKDFPPTETAILTS